MRARIAAAAATAVTVGVPLAAGGTAVGIDLAERPPELTPENIAAKFAPILRLDNDELFVPIDRRGYVESTHLRVRRRAVHGWRSETINDHPTVASLGPKKRRCAGFPSCHYYLKVLGPHPRDGSAQYEVIQSQLLHRGIKPTVYWRLDESSSTLQYWFFYVFNDFVNRHEGDWEQITILLGPKPALRPLKVGFSSHHGGQSKLWFQLKPNDGKVGSHVIVYVAFGSHANYFSRKPHPLGPCPTTRPKRLCTDHSDGKGLEFVADQDGLTSEKYELAQIDWQKFSGDYGSGNYVGRGWIPVGWWKVTVADPLARGDVSSDPECWLANTHPADDLTAIQHEQLAIFRSRTCPEETTKP